MKIEQRTIKEVIKYKVIDLLYHNPKLLETFKKLLNRTYTMTSDCGISIKLEDYKDYKFHLGGYRRLIIEGCRTKQTITYENGSDRIIRKPYKSKPFKTESFNNIDGYEILKKSEEYLKW